jgi:hypothetical protein
VGPDDPFAEGISKSAEHLMPPDLAVYRGNTGWESQIDALLAENVTDRIKADRLLRRLPFLPADAYNRATQEAVDRLPDADYRAVALPLILDPETHGAVESVLFADLLERPDLITLPVLLEIARQPEHPFAKSAIDNLSLLLGADHREDWSAWQRAIDAAIAAPAP